jgi:3-mercaptopyruvate sulfurtransferase SseA
MIDWNDKVKRLLKSELIKRSITNAELAQLLTDIGIEETKTSIDSKISRGTFSASFFIQSLMVIGCNKIELEEYSSNTLLAAEPISEYKLSRNGK